MFERMITRFIDRQNSRFFQEEGTFALKRQPQLEREFAEENGVRFNVMRPRHRDAMVRALHTYRLKAFVHAMGLALVSKKKKENR